MGTARFTRVLLKTLSDVDDNIIEVFYSIIPSLFQKQEIRKSLLRRKPKIKMISF